MSNITFYLVLQLFAGTFLAYVIMVLAALGAGAAAERGHGVTSVILLFLTLAFNLIAWLFGIATSGAFVLWLLKILGVLS